MKVHLSFDVEIWCDGWDELDRKFPAQFERYVYGRSAAGDFALPHALEVLTRHGLPAVFFVEPLFAGRFGIEPLREIVALIQDAGQEVQLHLHPEWADEIRPLPFEGARVKRQHLSYYSLDEQVTLLSLGLHLLAEAGAQPIKAFRAGSFACNADTFKALSQIGLRYDSSLNPDHPDSGLDLRAQQDFYRPSRIEAVETIPMTVFRDGLGKPRPAQVGACSFVEMRAALESAKAQGLGHFMILSHNFETLVPGSTKPDRFVVERFEQLCAYLAAHADAYEVCGFNSPGFDVRLGGPPAAIRAPLLASARRHLEQLARRLL